MKILLFVICAFFAGALLAVPIGLGINARMNPVWAVPMALIMMTGLVACSWLFFAPGAPFYTRT